MIPKIIHYCWFGGNPLPDSAKICIESWKRNCPDFEIREWNESNFDINSHQFVKECYEAKKFGFIVDVLRTYVLKEHGGIYLDTDTEIIKPLEDYMLNLNAFISYEDFNSPNVGFVASEKNGALVNDVYNLYSNKNFINHDGSLNTNFTGPKGFREIISSKENAILNGEKQDIENYVTIFPKEYFCAKSYTTGLVELTTNTYAVHHYDASWHSEIEKQRFFKNQYANRFKESIKLLKQNPSSNIELFSLFLHSSNLTYVDILKLLAKKGILSIKNKLK